MAPAGPGVLALYRSFFFYMVRIKENLIVISIMLAGRGPEPHGHPPSGVNDEPGRDTQRP